MLKIIKEQGEKIAKLNERIANLVAKRDEEAAHLRVLVALAKKVADSAERVLDSIPHTEREHLKECALDPQHDGQCET